MEALRTGLKRRVCNPAKRLIHISARLPGHQTRRQKGSGWLHRRASAGTPAGTAAGWKAWHSESASAPSCGGSSVHVTQHCAGSSVHVTQQCAGISVHVTQQCAGSSVHVTKHCAGSSVSRWCRKETARMMCRPWCMQVVREAAWKVVQEAKGTKGCAAGSSERGIHARSSVDEVLVQVLCISGYFMQLVLSTQAFKHNTHSMQPA